MSIFNHLRFVQESDYISRGPHKPIRTVALLALGMSCAGCASVDPVPDYEEARTRVTQVTGVPDLYQPGEEESAAQRVEELLLDGLSVEEAVEVALLNNGELRTLLFEIGVRRADAVQAGLLSNPSLNALVRFPLGGGSTVTEMGLVQNVIELWQLPARERMAEGLLAQTVLEVAHTAALLATETKVAYYRTVAALAARAAGRENRTTATEFLELTLERQAAGAATQVDLNAARSAYIEQSAAVREADYEVFDSGRDFLVLLGLGMNPDDLNLTEALADLPDLSFDLPGLMAIARDSRLDLRAAEVSIGVAEDSLELERRSVFRKINAGLSFESEGGETILGPLVRMEIPIFDQNQAQIAKAAYRVEQARQRRRGLLVIVDQEVRGAYEQHAVAVDMAHFYRDELLPLRLATLDLARESFREGKTGFLSVLDAQRRLLESRREYVRRLEDLGASVPILEAACGRPLRQLGEPEAGPSSEP